MTTASEQPVGPANEALPFTVAGIGASAGGITALETLFQNITASNIAYVVVQHLLPDQPSQLARLFGGWTPLPVREATDGMPLHAGTIYVAPPGKVLAINHGVFATQPLDTLHHGMGIGTIDSFFESLADAMGARSIGVVLSGTGSDGATGAIRIKQAGGTVLVQDPNTAMHDGMPHAVIASGSADHIMPLGALAEELVACAEPGYVRSSSATTWADDVGRSLAGMIDLIRSKTGFDLGNYKTTPLLWRIQRRMQLRRVSLFRDYEALLHDNPAELETLIRTMPIHVTGFFRDADLWTVLDRDVIPELFNEARDRMVRAWTTACSTGEEAYSLAMLLAEHSNAAPLERAVDFQVFATDASAEIVGRAGRGTFKPAAVSTLSPERRQRFFYAADGGFRVQRALREKMIFAPQDLLADPPISGLDLITCRNLLIYLEPDAARHVIFLLHSALRIGGYLFLGSSETLPPTGSGFDEVVARSHIYRKTGRAMQSDFAFPRRPTRLPSPGATSTAMEAVGGAAALEANDQPAVLVDDVFQILRVFGDTSGILRFKPGEPSLNLMDLVPAATAFRLRNAARDARSQMRTVTLSAMPDPTTGDLTLIVRLTPTQTADHQDVRFLVAFCRSAIGHDDAVTTVTAGQASRDLSEQLRISHAELESSREELQALNEELRASNDQLNLTNDELTHTNSQLRDKLEELATQSSVMSSGAVMTLFLDDKLRIRFFTPGVSELFPVRASDLGRRVTDLVPHFEQPRFLEHISTVMSTEEPVEAEIQTSTGQWYMERIRPFRAGSGDSVVTGVAITFTDITDRKRAEDALRRSETALAGELEAMTRLHAFSTAANSARNVGELLEQALDTLMHFNGADMGDIQVYDPRTQVLRICACRGFEPWFVEKFAEVPAAGNRAMALRGRVTIEDVETSDDEETRETAARAGYRALQSAPLVSAAGAPLGIVSLYFRQPRKLGDAEQRAADILSNELSSALERIRADDVLRESEQMLRRTRGWLAAEKEAFQSAMNGAPLATSLGILIRAAVEQSEGERRCAFYIANAEGTELRHVVGMSEAYAKSVDGFRISPDSLACGLAVATGHPVITPDVLEEPRWQAWTSLAHEHGFRACWSFPVETSTGKLVGSFAMYFKEPHAPTIRDRELAETLARTAAIIISRHLKTGGN